MKIKNLLCSAAAVSAFIFPAIANAEVEKAYTRSRQMKISVSLARTNDRFVGDDEEGIEDYMISLQRAADKSDLIEINISCPNTMVGERFVTPDMLDRLLTGLDRIQHKQPLMVKLPQDKEWDELKDLLDVICEHNVQGVTIANLRKDRSGLSIPSEWKGNLSGRPCETKANSLIEQTYREYGTRLAIAGVGGVSTAEQAYWKIRHGSSLIMLVSALMYQGPQVMTQIRQGVAELLRRDGFEHISDAVGVDVQ